MFAGAVAVGLLLSVAGVSQPAVAEEAAAPPAAMVGVEYDGRQAKGTDKLLSKKVRGEKKTSKMTPTASSTASSTAAPEGSSGKPAAKSTVAAALPLPGQGSFDANGDFVLPPGPRDPMIPILEDNIPRREGSPVPMTFFDMDQDPTVRKAKLAAVLFGPSFLYLFFFVTGSLGIL